MDTWGGLTINMIISKFVPILGALLFTTGLGYLIYTSVWEEMSQTIRLGVGFFASLVIIGTAFSFSERLKYFADVIMWWGILLLYGTLIYGSRTTDAARALIPEQATLITAFLFTLWVAYFSSLRRSKVILALGILGAYLTPFVIWQNDVWASNISFNAYLIYFATVNIAIFMMGREIAIHDLIPLNLLWLYFGTYTLHSLVYMNKIHDVTWGFLQSNNFTVILLVILVTMSILSIAFTSRYFAPNEEVWISAGYLVPLLWFFFHFTSISSSLSLSVQVGAFASISIAYFVAWYFLRPLESSRYQHVAAYAGWLISLVFAINALFPDFNLSANLLVAYIGIIFAVLYIFDGNKGERLIASFLFSCFGAILAFSTIYGKDGATDSPTLLAIISLIPAILLSPISRINPKLADTTKMYTDAYSITAMIIAILLFAIKMLKELDFSFAIFILPWCIAVLYSYFQWSKNPARSTFMVMGTLWLSIGYFMTFIYLIANFAPHVADKEHFWKEGGIFTNWYFIKGIFAVVTYSIALSVSRQIQKEQKTDRPSFLLVILVYTSLLLLVNFLIITFCNDLWIAFTTGWPRAITTTLWWIILSISMLFTGIHFWYGYRSEKFLGLLLLVLTIAKIAIYDLQAMEMRNKIVVLMVVGGLLLVFSYFLQVKWYLKEENKK